MPNAAARGRALAASWRCTLATRSAERNAALNDGRGVLPAAVPLFVVAGGRKLRTDHSETPTACCYAVQGDRRAGPDAAHPVDLMEACWESDPHRRPAFDHVLAALDSIAHSAFTQTPHESFHTMQEDWKLEIEQVLHGLRMKEKVSAR
ncbi:Mitogen-activated protein kinase kinase kinase 21 [Gryllus bimaculatus]|nr:Mitogen-activated protein kinase kinase kinase 21 [Gryllus bimaculatus]